MIGLIFDYIKRRQNRKQEVIDLYNDFINQIGVSMQNIDSVFSDVNIYVDPYSVAQWKVQWKDLIDRSGTYKIRKRNKSPLEKETLVFINQFNDYVINVNSKTEKHNSNYVEKRLPMLKNIICPIEKRNLDDQQLSCIVRTPINHLVIAGAGTGKTTTVVAQVKYLIKAKIYKPSNILALSFTNKSATEMRDRIKKETGEGIDVMTFHKLGVVIITAVEGVKPNITQIKLATFIRECLKELMKNPGYMSKFVNYLCFHNSNGKTEFDFTTESQYSDYLLMNPSVTLNKEVVKSYGEMQIANYLYKNGINYIYENPYLVNTATKEHGRYIPDFYLPDENIYIEYFALNHKKEVPSYFTAKNNKTPTQTYRESIDWKRQCHRENKTIMLELCFSDMQDGQLFERLKFQLEAQNVAFNPRTDAEVWEGIKATNGGIFESIMRLFETVINLTKINAYAFKYVFELNKKISGVDYQSNLCVLQLIEPIFNLYEKELQHKKEIDFNDMINLASSYVKQEKYRHAYQYVIVDEYQDISKARYNLLKNMRDQKQYSLFCVGDDWQSIYGFTGSDISYILDFEKYWGVSEKSKIETTYRFSQSLITASSQFVMRNPKQIKKQLMSISQTSAFALGMIEGYTEKNSVDFMADKIIELPKNSSVYFIGRYNHDVKMFNNSPFECHYENATGKTIVKYPRRGDLKIEFLTAHKSKGLEADYVFILNNKGNNYGFPSKIQNNSVVKLLQETSDDYEYSEERRLFYVAMTRTRKKVWMLVQKENKSLFAEEIIKMYGQELNMERYACPKCSGHLVKRKSSYGFFFGCSNYKNGCTYTKNIKPKKEQIKVALQENVKFY